jgi:cell division protein FtsQ
MKKKKKLSSRARSSHNYRNDLTGEKPPFPNPQWIAGIIVMLLIGFGLFRLGRHLVIHSQMFVLKNIKVEGNSMVESREIMQLASLQLGSRLFQIPKAEISNKILKNPYFKGVSLSRSLPSTLIISVQEREPVAYLIDQKIYMIDEYGKILLSKPGMPVTHLPLVTGLPVSILLKNREPLFAALNLITLMREVDSDLFQFVSEIHIDTKLPPCLFLIRGGARVEMGNDQLHQRIFILSNFVKNPSVFTQLENIKKIDLSFKDRVIILKKS